MSDQAIIDELVKVLEKIAYINAEHLRANEAYDERVAEWMPSAYAAFAKVKAKAEGKA